MSDTPKFVRLHWHQILVRNRTTTRVPASLLRRAMLEAGWTDKCERCQLLPEWCGKPLTLQIDHIDGDIQNNEPTNIRFICPNCHTQTFNFGAKNRNRLGEVGIDELYMYPDDYEEEVE